MGQKIVLDEVHTRVETKGFSFFLSRLSRAISEFVLKQFGQEDFISIGGRQIDSNLQNGTGSNGRRGTSPS